MSFFARKKFGAKVSNFAPFLSSKAKLKIAQTFSFSLRNEKTWENTKREVRGCCV